MATQEAWNDFDNVKDFITKFDYAAKALRVLGTDLEVIVNGILANQDRINALVALADTNPGFTSAALTERYGKAMAVKTALVAQGF